MSQYIGLILLIMAVAAGIYLASNTDDLLRLKLEVPEIVRPKLVSLPSTGIGEGTPAAESNQLPLLENKKLVRINSLRRPTNFNNYLELVLASNLSNNETLDITGWTIKSNSSSFNIPKAQAVYSFGGGEGDVVLNRGDLVYLYSGRGAKGNFRLNKCLGYIEDIASFTPSLPRSCPYIKRSDITYLSGKCQDYLLSLRACENPVANPPVEITDSACHDFLRKLNYVGCVEKYQNNPDFLENEWRLWLGDQISIFDPLHDRVQLLDRFGKMVDEYVY